MMIINEIKIITVNPDCPLCGYNQA
ncbi:hypothetical protein LCGC14_2242770, partial [marine sediment metagenome]